MKKRTLLLLAVFAATIVCAATAAAGIVIYSDSCKKCVITNTERKCGKCGGHMSSTYDKKLTEQKKDGYAYYTYSCSNKSCNHECYGKLKL